jgi:dolichol-phosphate mannosyltransferase
MRRSGELARFIKFALVGASGVLVDLGLTSLLADVVGLDYRIAGVIGTETAIITNFTLNHFFTFADCRVKGIKSFLTCLIKFNLLSLIGLGINNGIMIGFTETTGLDYRIGKLLGILVATLWNYLTNNWWTWKR